MSDLHKQSAIWHCFHNTNRHLTLRVKYVSDIIYVYFVSCTVVSGLLFLERPGHQVTIIVHIPESVKVKVYILRESQQVVVLD